MGFWLKMLFKRIKSDFADCDSFIAVIAIGGLGADSVYFLQGIVDNASVVGIERIQLHRLACFKNAVCQ